MKGQFGRFPGVRRPRIEYVRGNTAALRLPPVIDYRATRQLWRHALVEWLDWIAAVRQREAAAMLAQWWDMRRQRQAEIDASIARHAIVELLYDQPYSDPKRTRVTGPFTIERLGGGVPAGDVAGWDALILAHLRTAGVQNGTRAERLMFTSLSPLPGPHVTALGSYTDAAGVERRAAIAVAPAGATVTAEMVRAAAGAADHGADVLVMVAAAFAPGAGSGAGDLPVILARVNPDLSLGDALKNTGAGNLFMAFGEPDIVLEEQPDGRLVAELRGVDVFDPTTGAVRSSGPDEIACWFMDTDYDGRLFVVRHAYFSGGGDPYGQLRRALRAEIDEGAWEALYGTTSLPFVAPTTGRVAVKVLDHYGDETMSVYELAA